MPLLVCLTREIPGGYEASWGHYTGRGKTEEEATAALRAKLPLAPTGKGVK